MSGTTFLLVSLALGATCSVLLLTIDRKRRLANWRRALIVVTALLLSFNLTSAFGGLLLGDAALPDWSHATRSLWMVAMGTTSAFNLHPTSEGKSALARPMGFFMIAVGVLAVSLSASGAYLF